MHTKTEHAPTETAKIAIERELDTTYGRVVHVDAGQSYRGFELTFPHDEKEIPDIMGIIKILGEQMAYAYGSRAFVVGVKYDGGLKMRVREV